MARALTPDAAQAQVADAPWPMFGQNAQQTRLSPHPGPEPPVGVKWHFEGSRAGSAPAIGSDGTLYFGFTDGSLYAIGPEGEEKWRFETDSDIAASPAIGADGTIYVASKDGHLYALDRKGKENWRFETNGRIVSSPTIGPRGTVYVGSGDSHLYAIGPDGTEKWRFKTGEAVYSSPAIGADGTIYVGSEDSHLYAIGPGGEEQWRFETGDRVYSSPAVGTDGTVYVGSGDSHLYAIGPDGTEKWHFETSGSVLSSPAIGADGTIYVGSKDGNVYAITPSGKEKWRFKTDLEVYSSPAIGADGTVYVGSHSGYFYAISPSGKERWHFKTSGGLESPAVIGTDGTVYATSLHVYAFATVDETRILLSNQISKDTITTVVGRKRRRGLWIRNMTTDVLEGRIEVSGESSPFSVVEGEGAYRLQPGERQKVVLEYAPTDVGTDQGKLVVYRSGPQKATPIEAPLMGSASERRHKKVKADPVLEGLEPSQDSDVLVTAQDLRDRRGGCEITKTYTAELEEGASARDSVRFETSVQEILDQIGTGGPFDLTSLSYVSSNTRIGFARPLPSQSHPSSADTFRTAGAEYMWVSTSASGQTVSSYWDMREDGRYHYGYKRKGRYTRQEVFDPPRRRLALPLQAGTSWSWDGLSNSRSGSYNIEYSYQIVDDGRLVTPDGEAPSLVGQWRSVNYLGSDTLVKEGIHFWGKDGQHIASVDMGEEGEAPTVTYSSRTEVGAGSVGEGFITHCTFLGDLPVAFARPTGWTVVDLQQRASFLRGVTLVRDPEAAEEISSGTLSISTGQKARLITSGNVMVGISIGGEMEPKKSLERTIQQPPLEEPQVVQKPTETSVAGRRGAEIRVKGTDADGRTVVYREIAIPVDGGLLTVTVLQPGDMPESVKKEVQGLLDSLSVMPL